MKITATQLNIVRHGMGWKVTSASTPGTFYFVTKTPHLRCTCSAWGFGHGVPCRHIRAVRAMLKEDAYRGD
jgi:hypothetical protein